MVTRVPVSRLMVEWQQPDALGGFGAVYFAETTDGDQVSISPCSKFQQEKLADHSFL